jgi:hypothetical protein
MYERDCTTTDDATGGVFDPLHQDAALSPLGGRRCAGLGKCDMRYIDPKPGMKPL